LIGKIILKLSLCLRRRVQRRRLFFVSPGIGMSITWNFGLIGRESCINQRNFEFWQWQDFIMVRCYIFYAMDKNVLIMKSKSNTLFKHDSKKIIRKICPIQSKKMREVHYNELPSLEECPCLYNLLSLAHNCWSYLPTYIQPTKLQKIDPILYFF